MGSIILFIGALFRGTINFSIIFGISFTYVVHYRLINIGYNPIERNISIIGRQQPTKRDILLSSIVPLVV